MAGRTPNRNTRGPSGANRRPAAGSRRPTQSTRRSAQGRRRSARRRSPSLISRPGFWLFICIVIIVLILIFRGCGSEDMTEGQSAVPTDSISESGPIIMGNTEPVTEPQDQSQQGGGNSTNTTPRPDTDNGTPKPSTPEPNPDGENGGDTVYLTKSVDPGVYLISGRSGGLPAGRVNIEVLSGTGYVISSDGELSTGVISLGSTPVTAHELTAGVYLTVTGDLNLKVSYISEPDEPSVLPPSVKEDSQMYELGSYDTDMSYVVMSEGGDLKPGIYQVEIHDGDGVLAVMRKSGGAVDFTIGKSGGLSDTVNYLKLYDGDRVTVNGCVLVFTEMKEG